MRRACLRIFVERLTDAITDYVSQFSHTRDAVATLESVVVELRRRQIRLGRDRAPVFVITQITVVVV